MRFVYSLHPNITHAKNPWLHRLAYFADPNVQKVILRAVFATRKQYVAHLRNATDWDNSTEDPQLLDLLEKKGGNRTPPLRTLKARAQIL